VDASGVPYGLFYSRVLAPGPYPKLRRDSNVRYRGLSGDYPSVKIYKILSSMSLCILSPHLPCPLPPSSGSHVSALLSLVHTHPACDGRLLAPFACLSFARTLLLQPESRRGTAVVLKAHWSRALFTSSLLVGWLNTSLLWPSCSCLSHYDCDEGLFCYSYALRTAVSGYW
jgi:hypothetical protein